MRLSEPASRKETRKKRSKMDPTFIRSRLPHVLCPVVFEGMKEVGVAFCFTHDDEIKLMGVRASGETFRIKEDVMHKVFQARLISTPKPDKFHLHIQPLPFALTVTKLAAEKWTCQFPMAHENRLYRLHYVSVEGAELQFHLHGSYQATVQSEKQTIRHTVQASPSFAAHLREAL